MPLKNKHVQLACTLIILLLFSSFIIDRRKQQLKLSASIDKWEKRGQQNYLHVNIQLENTSADTVVFMHMTCSPPFVVDSKNFSRPINDCLRNIVQYVTIAPKETYETTMGLESIDSAEVKNMRLRIVAQLLRVEDILIKEDGSKRILMFYKLKPPKYLSKNKTTKGEITATDFEVDAKGEPAFVEKDFTINITSLQTDWIKVPLPK